MRKRKDRIPGISVFTVAFMYIGTQMGAGFASGREIWQFMGVFGRRGIAGAVLVGVLFLVASTMAAYIARKIGSSDPGRVIVPFKSPRLNRAMSYFVRGILVTVLLTMTAAGGAMLNQLFGLPRFAGGVLVLVLTLVTVFGGFERVSGVFRAIQPIIVAIILVTCVLVLLRFSAPSEEFIGTVTPLAPVWPVGAVLYIGLNFFSFVPMVATASLAAKSDRTAVLGAALGSLLLAGAALLLTFAIRRDAAVSDVTDMPMLYFAEKVGNVALFLYGILLFLAIYASATGNFYGFASRVQFREHHKLKVTVIGIACLFLGLVGFKNIIAYLFPVVGVCGVFALGLMTVTFFKVRRLSKLKLETAALEEAVLSAEDEGVGAVLPERR